MSPGLRLAFVFENYDFCVKFIFSNCHKSDFIRFGFSKAFRPIFSENILWSKSGLWHLEIFTVFRRIFAGKNVESFVKFS